MDLNKLLSLLSDGEFHSGSELGVLMGVTRTSIWKAVPSLQELSVPIETVKGKGYRIPGGLDLLNVSQILSLLPPVLKRRIDLNLLLSHASTNDYLAASVAPDLNSYKVCLAEHQLSGRGRRGREWVSPFAKNITLSASFLLAGGVEVLSGLSLVIGLAVARTLENLGVVGVGLKWPNDVFINEKKVAGILVELSGEATTGWNVICGIGLNVNMTEEEGVSIEQKWCSIAESVVLDRNLIVSRLLEELIGVLDKFKVNGFECFLSEWSRLDVLKGKEVLVMPNGAEGTVVGVNSQGALLLETVKGEVVVNAGEVSVRRK